MDSYKRFRLRPFVSLLTGFLFVALVVSGVILYITPPGRIANWAYWGLTKHQWGSLHICLSVSFLIASLIHIWLNFKPLMNYFVSRSKDALKLRLEWIFAIALCGIIVWGSLKPFAPFSSLLTLNERIKFSWDKPQYQAPIPHAELLTIEELAKESDITVETLVQNLKSAGIEVDSSDIFGDIAERQNVSPDKLFAIATGTESIPVDNQHGKGQGGGGFGQKTLSQACEEMGIETEDAIKALKTAGIETQANMRIREIADQNNVHPSQIRQILENL